MAPRIAFDAWMQAKVLYVVSFLDLMAVSMIIPSLSSYVKSMDGGAVSAAICSFHPVCSSSLTWTCACLCLLLRKARSRLVGLCPCTASSSSLQRRLRAV